MTGSAHLSDRMPDVAHGRAVWTDADRSHLAACTECAAEWRVVSSARSLGAEWVTRVSADRMADRVLTALRTAPTRLGRSPALPVRWLVTAAAAAALLLALWRGPFVATPSGAGEDLAWLLPEIEHLEDPSDLQAMLTLLPGDGSWSWWEVRGFEDMSEEELEVLLRSLEG